MLIFSLCLLLLASFNPFAAAAVIGESEPNNDFAHADPVQCGDTVLCATLDPETEFDHYRIHLDAGDSLVACAFSCEGSITNTVMVLFNDRDSILAVDDNSGPQWFSQIRYRSFCSANYIIRMLKHPDTPDSAYSLVFDCSAFPPEDYDLCETARIIPSLPYYDEGSTLGQTDQCGTDAPDVFYRLVIPGGSTLFVTVCTDEFDARVQVIGRCYGDYWDDADEGCGLGAELACFSLSEGEYYLLVEGVSGGQVGDFSITVNAALPGCPEPQPLVLGRVGDYPLLDWPQFAAPSYYVIWYALAADGPWEHLGTSLFTYFVDSTGYADARRFYRVTAVCPWSSNGTRGNSEESPPGARVGCKQPTPQEK
ncbi:MAG: hypothetical protein PHI18_10145 [bacterium]|nr:hypothetical protein [bacterium]